MQFNCIICWGMFVFWYVMPVVQFTGLTGKHWLSSTACSVVANKPACCHNPYSQDLRSECNDGFQLKDLDDKVAIIQLVSGILSLVPISLISLDSCQRSLCHGTCTSVYLDMVSNVLSVVTGVSFLLFPVSGVLSIVGCLLLIKNYSGFSVSFYLCLTAGIIWLVYTLAVLIRCILAHRKNKREETLLPENKSRTSYFFNMWINGFYFQDY